MTNATKVLAALASLAPALAAANGAPTQVELSVSGTGNPGKVFGQVFGDAAAFKSRSDAVLRFSIDPEMAPRARITLSLPPGRYAVAMFQDTKGTGKVETNMLGIPTVPYGFSNNARGLIGPPGFEAAAFDVGATPQALSIVLR